VTVVSGPATEPLPAKARVIRVERAEEMARALEEAARSADVIIMAAAVSDFRPLRVAASKLTRRGRMHLAFEATPDLIARLPRRPRQVVIGFALETHGVVARANAKLRAKRLDLVLAQQANGTQGPFGRHPVRAWLLSRDGGVEPLGTVSKSTVARALLDKIEALWYGQHRSEGRRKPEKAEEGERAKRS
jgi:phosphopantothenoylcysteine decarboxylase/phosphopantothenate--cysteine ligase